MNRSFHRGGDLYRLSLRVIGTMVRQTRQKETDLTALSLPGQPGHRPPAETPDCKGVEQVDVLEHRLTRTGQP